MGSIRYIALIAAWLFAAAGGTQAQSLNDPAVVTRMMDIVQFGLPGDAKLIFCETEDCPERTTKTLATLPNPVEARKVNPLSIEPAPRIALVQERVETPAPKAESLLKKKHKPRRKKINKKAPVDCKVDK